MNKKIIGIMMILAAIFLVAGCNNESPVEYSPPDRNAPLGSGSGSDTGSEDPGHVCDGSDCTCNDGNNCDCGEAGCLECNPCIGCDFETSIWQTVTVATCKDPGVEKRTCTLGCSKEETRPIAIDTNAHNVTTAWQVRNGGELFKGCAHGCGKADTLLSNQTITRNDITPIANQITDTLIIPAGVTSIGGNAFSANTINGIDSVTFLADNIAIDLSAFGGISSMKGAGLRTMYRQNGVGVYTYNDTGDMDTAWTFTSLN